jgi:RNA polymerase sigma-B factor
MAARDELVQRFLPLARRLARRYRCPGEPLDDLEQVASMGLVKAIERFDANREAGFSSYATVTILGELKRYLRDLSWVLHVPRGAKERALQVNKAADDLYRKLGRHPTSQHLADELGFSVEEAVEAMQAAAAYHPVPLDAPLQSDGPATVADSLAYTDDAFELVEHRAGLRRGLRSTRERERHILYLRFSEGLHQREIADRIGISQMQVSRLLRRELERLRLVAGAAPRPAAIGPDISSTPPVERFRGLRASGSDRGQPRGGWV